MEHALFASLLLHCARYYGASSTHLRLLRLCCFITLLSWFNKFFSRFVHFGCGRPWVISKCKSIKCNNVAFTYLIFKQRNKIYAFFCLRVELDSHFFWFMHRCDLSNTLQYDSFNFIPQNNTTHSRAEAILHSRRRFSVLLLHNICEICSSCLPYYKVQTPLNIWQFNSITTFCCLLNQPINWWQLFPLEECKYSHTPPNLRQQIFHFGSFYQTYSLQNAWNSHYLSHRLDHTHMIRLILMKVISTYILWTLWIDWVPKHLSAIPLLWKLMATLVPILACLKACFVSCTCP